MTREYRDLLTHNQECVRFGEKQLGYKEVLNEEINYMKQDLNTVQGKINIVQGDNLKKNKQAIRKNHVDVLIDPFSSKEREFDQSTATVARENNVTIGITLKNILRATGMDKPLYLRSLNDLGKLIRRKNCNFIITSGAEDPLDMRSPRELASLAYLIGFNKEESLNSVSKNVQKIIENKKNLKK